MHALRNVATSFAVAVGLAAGAVFGVPGVRATTGPSQDLPPTYKVSNAFAGQFTGQYVLKSLPPAARIQSAALGIEVSDAGYLYGVGQFYGYDQSGSQSSWVARLYRFHQTSKSQMTIELLAPGTGTAVLGHLVVAPPRSENLIGKITLGTHTYPVTFHRISKR